MDLQTKWVGREILFPQDMIFTIYKDRIKLNLNDFDYKIITYIDSTNCTICNLKFLGWDKLMSDLLLSENTKIGVFHIINSNNQKEIIEQIHINNYQYPVFFDVYGDMESLNHFSEDTNIHTFLLDSDNKILDIGNPLDNDTFIRYLNIMGLNYKSQWTYPIKPDRFMQSIGVVSIGNNKICKFVIENTLKEPVTVHKILTSCYCTSATIDNDTIQPDKLATVTVCHHATEDSEDNEFNDDINIFFNEVETPLCLKIKGYNSVLINKKN